MMSRAFAILITSSRLGFFPSVSTLLKWRFEVSMISPSCSCDIPFVRETFEVRHVGSRGLMLVSFREFYSLFTAPNCSFYFWQIFLNILLFIPFGFTLSCYLYKYHRSRHLFLPILLSGLFVSISVEIFQYITSRGFTEIDDVK